MKNKIKVVELFAGVGGFRLGLEGWQGKSPSSGYKDNFDSIFEVVWSNQWEPLTKTQHASLIYESRWGKSGHSNEDVASVDVSVIPQHEMLVGGFPCQDYSVATTLKNSKGLIGKKGVLWWSIHRILSEVTIKPKYLLLENVDRLLISPSSQRGRDFAIILQSLNDLGYAVEWRVVNAADYGMPQRRRRVFILATHQSSIIHRDLLSTDVRDWITSQGVMAKTFPIDSDNLVTLKEFELSGDIVEISSNFNKNQLVGVFGNTGLMLNGKVCSFKTKPRYEGPATTLMHVIQKDEVSSEFYIDKNKLDKWIYLKGAKKEYRKNSEGFEYHYAEGGMVFPDPLDKPARTIITGEGGESPSRFKHVIRTVQGFRRLTPIELERINMFPDNHTYLEGVSNTKRAFLMGNALVVGVVERLAKTLSERLKNEPSI
jgi:DNA (cytosine-5)-methyltransferase 1